MRIVTATVKGISRPGFLAVGCTLVTAWFTLLTAVHAAPGQFAVIGTIPGPDGAWDYASIDGVARRLYVAHGDTVLAVDLDTGLVHPNLIAGVRLHTVVPLPGGKALVTDGGSNVAMVFDALSGTILATVPTGRNPDAAIFDSSSGLVLVMDAKDGDITLIDTKTWTSPGRITIGDELEFAATDNRGTAYVNVDDKNEIAVVNVAARKVVARYTTSGCEEPSGLALDPLSGLLVASCSNEKAIALRSKDGSVAALLPIGKGPDAVIFDPVRRLFFIPCESGTLSVISETDPAAPVISATISTAKGARTGALDPSTGRLYLPAAELAPGPPNEHPPSMPGTFRILIVASREFGSLP